MTSKTILMLLLLHLAGFEIQAQVPKADVAIQWGKVEKSQFASVVRDVFGVDSTGFYVLKNLKGYFAVARIDNNLNQVTEAAVDLKKSRHEAELQYTECIKNKAYVFYSNKERKTKSDILYCESLDPKTLQLQNDKKEICRIPYKSKSNAGNFWMSFSRERKYCLFFSNLQYEKGSAEKFHLSMYNEELNLKWKRDVTLPVNDDLFSMELVKADDSGNAYLAGRLYENKEAKKQENYTYKLFVYHADSEKPDEFRFDLDDKRPTHLQFYTNQNGDITVSGFYTESAKGNNTIGGCFYALINGSTRQVVFSSTKALDESFIKQYSQQSKTDKVETTSSDQKTEMKNYQLQEIRTRKDGGAYLIAEQSRTKSYYYSLPFAFPIMTKQTDYYLGDIIIVSISPQGNIEWARKIHKTQASPHPPYISFISYAVAGTNDKIFLIYNDHTDNLTKDDNDDLKMLNGINKNSVTMMVTINADGSLKKERLFDWEDVGLFVKPFACEQINDKEMVLFAWRNGKQQFAKMKLD